MMFYFLRLSLCFFIVSSANAETVVRMQVQQDTNIENVDIKLFEIAAPVTAASFLRFVDATPIANAPDTPTESYNNSFLHRLDSGRFIEGGKFTFTPPGDFTCTPLAPAVTCDNNANATFPDGLQLVTSHESDDLLLPEFFKLNLEGTIAMQQTSFSQFSPSSWFVNLQDNPSLDVAPGPFASPYTVFAEIINDTLSVVDGIDPAQNLQLELIDDSAEHFELNAFPLVNYTGLPDPILQANLVRINSIKKLFSIVSSVEPGRDSDTAFIINASALSSVSTITITNLNAFDLNITSIAISDVLDLPFIIDAANDNCSGTTLTTSSNCTFTLGFNSTIVDSFTDSFSIEFTIDNGMTIEKAPLSYIHKVSAGVIDTDLDGSPDIIEVNAPNSGDANYDGEPDLQQNHVVSFKGRKDDYVSLLVENFFSVSNFVTFTEDELQDLPSKVEFRHGAFELDITVLLPGSAIEVGLILPSGKSPEAFYFFGATDDNATNHWHEYDGAQILSDSDLTTVLGKKIERNLIKFVVQDGGAGDADNEVNGLIKLTLGAPAYPEGGDGGSSSSLNALFLAFLVILLAFFSCYRGRVAIAHRLNNNSKQ